MNRRHGLLAFGCTVLAVVAAVFQVPVVSGMEELGRLLAGEDPAPPSALAVALTPPTAAQLPGSLGGAKPLTLFALQRERRFDGELRRLAAQQQMPFALLKALLAQASQGVLADGGSYWARLPEGDGQVTDEGPARSQAAAALLGRYRRQTGSWDAALLAWRAGPLRAARVERAAAGTLSSRLRALRLTLLAPRRPAALDWLCTVRGLAAALEARWPVADHDLSRKEGAGLRLAAAPGERVAAAMAGRVGFVGLDGPRGLCVEVRHACRLRSVVCGLKTRLVESGQRVRAGQALGNAGPRRPRFDLWLGARALDAAQLMPPDSLPPAKPGPGGRRTGLETIELPSEQQAAP